MKSMMFFSMFLGSIGFVFAIGHFIAITNDARALWDDAGGEFWKDPFDSYLDLPYLNKAADIANATSVAALFLSVIGALINKRNRGSVLPLRVVERIAIAVSLLSLAIIWAIRIASQLPLSGCS